MQMVETPLFQTLQPQLVVEQVEPVVLGLAVVLVVVNQVLVEARVPVHRDKVTMVVYSKATLVEVEVEVRVVLVALVFTLQLAHRVKFLFQILGLLVAVVPDIQKP